MATPTNEFRTPLYFPFLFEWALSAPEIIALAGYIFVRTWRTVQGFSKVGKYSMVTMPNKIKQL